MPAAAVNTGLSANRFLTFSLGSESYGIRVLAVQEIMRLPAITAMPQLPDYWRGIINLRDRIIPVIDLRRRFGLARVRGSVKALLDIGRVLTGEQFDQAAEVAA